MNEIKFAVPDVGNEEKKRVKDTIDSRWLTNGPLVREFEKRIAKMSNCDYAVAFDSCTGAMEMTLRMLGIGPGDEVITTPYTYSATAEVIRNVGAKIVFVDLKENSFEMDYDKVAAAINEKTKAVMPVDIGGKLCDYDSLMAAVSSKKSIFKPNNLFQKGIGRVAVVADAAHSFGAEMNGKKCGEFADFTCYSFHVLKNITTGGEGGAVVWKDTLANFTDIGLDCIEHTLRLLGDHGQTSRDKSNGWEYDIALFGYNSIMTNMDAAMGLAQLDRYDEICKKRVDVTKKYDSLFETTDVAKPLIKHIGENYMSSMHLYPIQLNPKYASCLYAEPGPSVEEWRTTIYNRLRVEGIPCNVHYKPLPMMTAYKNAGYTIDDYPNARKMFSTLLTIPYHTDLTHKQQEHIFNQIIKAVKS